MEGLYQLETVILLLGVVLNPIYPIFFDQSISKQGNGVYVAIAVNAVLVTQIDEYVVG